MSPHTGTRTGERAAARRRAALLSLLAVALAAAACDENDPDPIESARALTAGEPARGRALIQQYGCGSCHVIEDVPGAVGAVGPPLDGIWKRMYVGGVVQHTPENLVRWIMNPKAIDPRTAMPDLGVSRPDAQDIAAYLYSIR